MVGVDNGAGAPPWRRQAVWLADRVGPVLGVAGGLGILASLWLPWFVAALPCALPTRPTIPCPRETVHHSAWDAFRTADIALAVLAGAVIALVIFGPAIAARLAPVLGVAPAFAKLIAHLSVSALGWLAVALTAYAIHRPAVRFDPSQEADFGFFVALVAAGAVIGGGWWSIVVGKRPHANE